MSPEAKLSWMIAAIAVAMFVLIMAWLFTAVEGERGSAAAVVQVKP